MSSRPTVLIVNPQAEVGPVVGTHAGPGVVAVSLFQPEEAEAGWIAPL